MISQSTIFQAVSWGIYILVNGLFIYKYSMRIDIVNPWVLIVAYCTFIAAVCHFAVRLHPTRFATTTLLLAATAGVALLLWWVEPLSVNVDRWSATTYFLDALFRGEYPYDVQTHMGNYSSPFPLWQYINIPFWLIGDVGLALIPFLWLLVYGVHYFTHSVRTTFFYMLLLLCSPAYWWEVVVRSDGMSNAILVFCVILFMVRRRITFTTRPIITSLLCALIVCTRLSAALPLGILLLNSWLMSSLRIKLLSITMIITVTVIFFAPYLLWGGDITTFLERNPFQTQTFQVSLPSLLILAMMLLYVVRCKRKSSWMLAAIPLVMFTFILTTMLWRNLHKPGISIWNDSDFDISYLSLSLPYSILVLVYTQNPKTTN